MTSCGIPVIGRRRTFWSTQACATEPDCAGSCETAYGLKYNCPNSGNCENYTTGKTRTIETDNWLKGLIINILFTDGRLPETACGWQPGARGGHWSDSYRPSEYAGTSGSMLRALTTHGTIAEALQEINVIARHDLEKLVKYGVADSIDVTSKYLGANTVSLDIIVYGVNGDVTKVGLSGKRMKNDWAWST